MTLLLILLLTSNHCAFAGSEPTVISDSTTQKKAMEAFADINKNTNNFFTPLMNEETRAREQCEKNKYNLEKHTEEGRITPSRGSELPVKKLRIMLQERKNPKPVVTEEITESTNQAILDCELMEYFAERTELEANGNVVMFFPKNNSTLKADKVVYNQTSNLIKAFGNVVVINDGKELFGDYMQMDMNEENAIMDKPTTDMLQVRSRAKKGYMYGDKLIQENGDLLITKKTMIKVTSEMFGPNLDYMYVNKNDKSEFKKDSHGEAFKIKTDELIINAKRAHDTITLKHAEVYYDGKKVGTIPSITMHTNKSQDYVEANYPELGTMSNLGFYAGPGLLFNAPMGTSLKVVPMINYDAGQLGGGAIVKFKSATNKLDMAYGTANNIFIARGKQRLDDNLFFQYGSNAYMDDWFMGFRMPNAMGELVYEDNYIKNDFIGKDLPVNFTHRIAAGYMQDRTGDGHIIRAEGEDGGVGTLRFKYMAEVAQTIFNYEKGLRHETGESLLYSSLKKDDILSTRLEMVFQGSAALYGTGDTQTVARVGPRLHTQYKYWMQDAGYFLSGYNDDTPLQYYDAYMYGRSNAYLRESLRLNKYVTLSWFGSLNLSQDSWDGKMLQENGFYFAIGPDDVKLNIGYDTVRQQSFVTMALALDAKGSSLEYKKMTVINPNKVGKDKDGNSPGGQSFSSPAPEATEGVAVERAEVINIEGT